MVRLATLLAAWRRCPSPRNLDLDPLSCSKTVFLAIYPGDPANPSRASLGRLSGALGRCLVASWLVVGVRDIPNLEFGSLHN